MRIARSSSSPASGPAGRGSRDQPAMPVSPRPSPAATATTRANRRRDTAPELALPARRGAAVPRGFRDPPRRETGGPVGHRVHRALAGRVRNPMFRAGRSGVVERRWATGRRPLLEGIPIPYGVWDGKPARSFSPHDSQWHGADELGQPAVNRYRPFAACSSQALLALVSVRSN